MLVALTAATITKSGRTITQSLALWRDFPDAAQGLPVLQALTAQTRWPRFTNGPHALPSLQEIEHSRHAMTES
jgi:hypothetical protein